MGKIKRTEDNADEFEDTLGPSAAFWANVVTQSSETEPVSKDNDGWCGEPCPLCKGGQFDDDGRSCGRCGGIGERYEAAKT